MGGNNSTRDRDSQTNVPPTMRNETTQQKLARENKLASTYASGADAYAKDKLGIQSTAVNSAMGGNMNQGFKSTANPYGKVNQSYGADYNQLRGEYLSLQGQAKKREVIDAMGRSRTVYDPVNSDGVYTNVSRGAAQNARDMGTPLSKEMFEGQQETKKMLLGLGGIMSGMPLAFTSLYYASKRPYSESVSNYYNKGRTTSTQTNRNNKDAPSIAASEGQQSSYSQTTARNKYKAKKATTLKTESKLEGRALYASANKLITGKMS